MEGRIKKKIHEVRKEIKKKYFRIKHGREQSEAENKKSLAPITDLLNKQLSQLEVKDDSLDAESSVKAIGRRKKINVKRKKTGSSSESDTEDLFRSALNNHVQSTPLNQNIRLQPNYSSSSISEYASKVPQTSNVLVDTNIASTSNNSMNDSMLKSFFKSKTNSPRWDRVNGPVKTKKGDLKFGDHTLLMKPSGITLKGVTFKNTDGLRELILKHKPRTELFDSVDLASYKQLLTLSNKKIKKNNSIKYQTIIKPITASGSGLLRTTCSGSQVDYRWWDNPNELVDRLKLLNASTSAGNNSHQNEIIAILEELREARIIV